MLNPRVHFSGIAFAPKEAPKIDPAVAAVQSLSMPIATVWPMTFVKSVPPMVSPQIVRQALLMEWTRCIPLKRLSTASLACR